MTYQLQAGSYLVTFISHAHADIFRRRVAKYMSYLPERYALDLASKVAWRYYAEPVRCSGVEMSDSCPIPYALWRWMQDNWATDAQEAA